MATRSCRVSPDNFCYVCGMYIGPKERKNTIVAGTKYADAYLSYFGMAIGDQDKSWAPHVICGVCRSTLEGWFRGNQKSMPFAIPRIWREPTNHVDDCYFCMVDITKNKKKGEKKNITYPDIPSSIAPVPHDEHLPIPMPKEKDAEVSEVEGERKDYLESAEEPHFINQAELDKLVRDLGLTKSGAELLTSRLRERNMLHPSCNVTKN